MRTGSRLKERKNDGGSQVGAGLAVREAGGAVPDSGEGGGEKGAEPRAC